MKIEISDVKSVEFSDFIKSVTLDMTEDIYKQALAWKGIPDGRIYPHKGIRHDFFGWHVRSEFHPYVQRLLDISIKELEFSRRSYHCLKHTDILFVRDLLGKTEADLRKVRGLGKKSLKEIKDTLSMMGLSLGMSKEEVSNLATKRSTQLKVILEEAEMFDLDLEEPAVKPIANPGVPDSSFSDNSKWTKEPDKEKAHETQST